MLKNRLFLAGLSPRPFPNLPAWDRATKKTSEVCETSEVFLVR
jgi:hypothetical protein